MAKKFWEVLVNNGIILSRSDKDTIASSFRGPGTIDVIKFDEFLRVCLVNQR